MTFHIITLFPKAFDSYLKESILKRAIEDEKIAVRFYNPRDFAEDKRARVDRSPYGGGPGMIIQALPVIKAIEKAIDRSQKKREKNKRVKIIFLNPGGRQFTNEFARKTSRGYSDIIVVCGRYEGIDSRVKKVFSTSWRTDEISIGPFVLTGGELPAMILIDVISRQKKGILGNFKSIEEKRIASHDVYTRPESFAYKGKKYAVPKILLSGHHRRIEEWKRRRT